MKLVIDLFISVTLKGLGKAVTPRKYFLLKNKPRHSLAGKSSVKSDQWRMIMFCLSQYIPVSRPHYPGTAPVWRPIHRPSSLPSMFRPWLERSLYIHICWDGILIYTDINKNPDCCKIWVIFLSPLSVTIRVDCWTGLTASSQRQNGPGWVLAGGRGSVSSEHSWYASCPGNSETLAVSQLKEISTSTSSWTSTWTWMSRKSMSMSDSETCWSCRIDCEILSRRNKSRTGFGSDWSCSSDSDCGCSFGSGSWSCCG